MVCYKDLFKVLVITVLLNQTGVGNEWLSKRLKIPKANLPLICNVLISHSHKAQSFLTQVQIFFFLGTSVHRNEYNFRAKLILTSTTVVEYMTVFYRN